MGCCGQRRTVSVRPPVARAITAGPVGATPAPNQVPRPASAAATGATAPLRYVRQSGIIVRGPVTGKQYAFTAAKPVQQVDAQDAAGLLRTSWFRRA